MMAASYLLHSGEASWGSGQRRGEASAGKGKDGKKMVDAEENLRWDSVD